MNEDSRRYIAALVHEPGFIALCDAIDGQVNTLTEDLQAEEDSATALRKLRVWQISRRFATVLRKSPEQFVEEIRLEQDIPRDEMLQFLARDEDVFSRRAPVPPPLAK